MQISNKDKVLIKIYECPICGKNYRGQEREPIFRCAVVHPPGTCCHFGEVQVARKVLAEIESLLLDNSSENEVARHYIDGNGTEFIGGSF